MLEESKAIRAKVLSNCRISENIFDMTLEAPEVAQLSRPGQFISMYPAGAGRAKSEHQDFARHAHATGGEMILPRPISICEADAETVRVVYQVVGHGTEHFSTLARNDEIRIIGPLGNGFDISKHKKTGIAGGGIGVPPLLWLCKKIVAEGGGVTAFLGFRKNSILERDFRETGADVRIATDSGDEGFRGNVVECMEAEDFHCETLYACGPRVMLKNVAAWAEKRGISSQVSMEERMACSIGACLGCVQKIRSPQSADGWEYKKVCADGPVFMGSEVVWDEC